MPRRFEPLKPLEGEQDQASSPAVHAALAASAGTGKTHVLTARVFRLLLRDVDPAAILCLTFTKAGAAEMTNRVHARLAHWVRLKDNLLRKELFNLGEANGPDDLERARSLFARVLEAPGGGLRIQTIHAFAQSLLSAFPAEAGLAPGFRPVEGREEALLARTTLADLLVRAEAGGDLPLIRDMQALSLRMGEGGVEQLLAACAKAPDALAALGPRDGIEARLRATFGLPLGDIDALVAEGCRDDSFDLATLERVAAGNTAWGAASGIGHAGVIAAWRAKSPAARAAGLGDLMAIVRTREGAPRKASSGLLKAAPDYSEHAERLAQCCERLLALQRGAALVTLFAAGMRAGQTYAHAYAEAKRAQGLVDFDDLIRTADRLLATDGIAEWVRYKLDSQVDHILVDEAQDTNASQWRIVGALAEEFFSGEGAAGRHRTLFTVGDFKQAIFSFQGTDPREFDAARAHFSSAARALRDNAEEMFNADERLPPDFLDLSMDRSFRSAPEILSVVDQVIDKLGHDALGLPRHPPLHVSHHATRAGTVTLWRPFTEQEDAEGIEEDGEEAWIPDNVRRYAFCLAKQIAAWLARPPHLECVGRRLQPQDILILVRSRGNLAGLLVARLHAEEVPVAGVDRLSLSQPLAVQDLIAAARFAVQPLDDLNLANLLVSPLLGWSQDDLFAAAFDRGYAPLWPHLRARAAAGDGPSLEPLLTMLGMADYLTPHDFFETLLSGPLDGRRRLLARLGTQARDPIEELLSSALDFEGTSAPSLARFLDWFARGEVEIVRDPSAPLDAVRVMTVHAAKGLEAPVVILADACHNPESKGGGVRLAALDVSEVGAAVPVPRPRKGEAIDPLASAMAAKDARDREEHWRLLYVALTRARERLYVGGAVTTADGVPESSWHRAVEGALAGLACGWEDDGHWGAAMTLGGVADRSVGGAPVARPREEIIPVYNAMLPAWLSRPAPQEERPPRPLAPSAPGEDEASYPPPGPEQRAAAMRGKLLHRLFERLPGVAADTRRERADLWLANSGDAPDAAFRAALIDDALRVIDDPAAAALFGPDALAETPIAAVIAGGQVVSGKVDRLLVMADRILVADFKTGRRVPERPEDCPPSHLRQMAAYRDALRIIFPDRPVAAALVYTSGPRLHLLAPDLLDRHTPAAG